MVEAQLSKIDHLWDLLGDKVAARRRAGTLLAAALGERQLLSSRIEVPTTGNAAGASFGRSITGEECGTRRGQEYPRRAGNSPFGRPGLKCR